MDLMIGPLVISIRMDNERFVMVLRSKNYWTLFKSDLRWSWYYLWLGDNKALKKYANLAMINLKRMIQTWITIIKFW